MLAAITLGVKSALRQRPHRLRQEQTVEVLTLQCRVSETSVEGKSNLVNMTNEVCLTDDVCV